MAWLPVMQPKPATTGSLCNSRQNFSAPSRAREYSMCTEPRRRATSAVAVGALHTVTSGSFSHVRLKVNSPGKVASLRREMTQA